MLRELFCLFLGQKAQQGVCAAGYTRGSNGRHRRRACSVRFSAWSWGKKHDREFVLKHNAAMHWEALSWGFL